MDLAAMQADVLELPIAQGLELPERGVCGVPPA
jgi:hypothetical protein